MVRSMTGFGRGNIVKDGREYLVEIRTVNHRYLDTSIRMSRAYSYLEGKIREAVNKRLARGKVDISIFIDDYGIRGRSVLLDEGLADLYIDALKKLKQRYSLNDDVSLSLITRIPDILKVRKEDEDEDTVWNELLEALNLSIDSLITMREKEGNQLKNDIMQKAEVLSTLLVKIEERAPAVVVEYKEKLLSRIKELMSDGSVDEGRLELEVALFADRCSIAEEITRFKSHIKQLTQALEAGQSIGRKLDFLVQEMNREVNTIGSKANDLDITKTVVEMKSEIEKIREQIQNIE